MDPSIAITKHKNFPQMLRFKSATYKRVITRTGITFAMVNRIYCLYKTESIVLRFTIKIPNTLHHQNTKHASPITKQHSVLLPLTLLLI